jgi:hypothetical protein
MRARGTLSIVVAAVAVALVLTGCSPGEPPAANTAKVVRSPSPSATPVAPVAVVPTVRVPATCDQLIPQTLADQAAGAHVELTSSPGQPFPSNSANDRVGALSCVWANGDVSSSAPDVIIVSLVVVPTPSRASFEYFRQGEQIGSDDTRSSLGQDSYTYCPDHMTQICGFHEFTPAYGIKGTVWSVSATHEALQAAVQSLLRQVHAVVATLGAPAPLWQPAGHTLRGASGCDTLATPAKLTSTVGLVSPRPVKTDEGEYSTSIFDADRQVGGFWCTWSGDAKDSGAVTVDVLPGGSSYAESARGDDARDVPGLGDTAFWSSSRLNVIADSAWLQIRVSSDGAATEEQLVQLARATLANLGYAG